MPPTLVHLPLSPWSDRVRTALALAGSDGGLDKLVMVEYTPFVDETWLRWRLGKWTGKVSVPVLLLDKGEAAICGSDAIARWIGARAAGGPGGKFRLGKEDVLARVEAACEKLMAAGRFCTASRVIQARRFDIDLVPWPLRWLPNAVHAGTSVYIYRTLRNKYAEQAWMSNPDLAHQQMREGLQELRDLLQAGGGTWFAGEPGPTYADVVVACAMSFAPGPGQLEEWKKHPGTKPCWLDEALCSEFSDLVAWRDRVRAELPPPRTS